MAKSTRSLEDIERDIADVRQKAVKIQDVISKASKDVAAEERNLISAEEASAMCNIRETINE